MKIPFAFISLVLLLITGSLFLLSFKTTGADEVYQEYCASCHGADLEGGNAHSLVDGVWQFDRAEEILRSSLVIHRRWSSHRAEGVALPNLGSLRGTLGDLDSCFAFFQEALEVHRRVGNRSSEAILLSNLGYAYLMDARPAEAIEPHL